MGLQMDEISFFAIDAFFIGTVYSLGGRVVGMVHGHSWESLSKSLPGDFGRV